LREGPLPPSGSFLSAEPESFHLTAIKQAESGSDIIVRGVNLSPDAAAIELASLRPIRTVSKVRLDETHLADVPLKDGHRIRFEAHGNEMVTLRFRFEGDAGPAAA